MNYYKMLLYVIFTSFLLHASADAQKLQFCDEPVYASTLPACKSWNPSVSSGLVMQNRQPTLSRRQLLSKADANNDVPELWGGQLYCDTWGANNSYDYRVAKFKAIAPLQVETVFANANFNANGGGILSDDILRFINYRSFLGVIVAYYYEYDATTWQQLKSEYLERLDFISTAQDYDATSGLVYGCFRTEDLAGYELAAVDYSTMTKTSLCRLDQMYWVIAVSGDGEIYGVGENGSFYHFDKQTGQPMHVGHTGLSPKYTQAACFDRQTGKMYWAACFDKEPSALYEVDITTGVASKIANFPDDEEFFFLHVNQPAASSDAPAVANELQTDFSASSQTGHIRFTMPTTTFGGNILNGKLTYTLKANGVTVKAGTSEPGQEVDVEVTVPEGQTMFAVTINNNAGRSPVVTLSRWVGRDMPAHVKNLTLNIDNETNEALLTWESSGSIGLHGGYVDAANLTYDVTAYPSGTLVAQGITDTRFTEQLQLKGIDSYYYEVTPIQGTLRGETAQSNKVVFGKPIVPPFFEDFDDQQSFDKFMVIDANNDGITWHWNVNSNNARIKWNNDQPSDDWLLTPPIQLQSRRIYQISYKARPYSPAMPAKMETAYGMGTNPSVYKELVSARELTSLLFEDFTRNIIVEEDNIYRIGFHDISDDPERYLIQLDSISIQPGAMLDGPDSVLNINVEKGAYGALLATITFDAPTHTVDGVLLNEITKIEVLRDGEVIHTFTDVFPGQKSLKLIDDTPDNGIHLYAVVPYNSKGIGQQAECMVFTGFDKPAPPKNIHLIDNETNLLLTWEAPDENGSNGGYCDVSNVWFEIYRYDPSRFMVYELATNYKSYSYMISQNPDEGDQQVYACALRSVTEDAGTGRVAFSNYIIIGSPHQLPFAESLTDGHAQNSGWMQGVNTGANKVAISTNDAQDGDGGQFAWQAAETGDEAWLKSGKILLAGAQTPVLTFYYRTNDTSTDTQISVTAMAVGDTEVPLWTFNLKGIGNGWNMAEIDLSALTAHRYIQLLFTLSSNTAGTVIGIDNIQIANGTLDIENIVPNNDGETEQYYTIDGQQLSNGGALKSGLYIVRKGTSTTKRIVKH